jgi:pyridoxal phosphate enzyme (YggS family)
MPERLRSVLERIAAAAGRAGRRAGEVRLVAASKSQPADSLRVLAAQGQIIFGESYLQEAEAKITALAGLPGLEWHFIGRLQSNKSGKAAALFSTVESLGSKEIAARLSRQAEKLGKELKVLLQISLARERNKSGCLEEEAEALSQYAAALPGLKLTGLMTLPPFSPDPEQTRPYFIRLRELARRLAPNLPPGAMAELSMGMSGDFVAAIEEGATLVRVGTALFGPRN